MSSDYQPAPAGEIEVEIVAASVGEVAWKASDDNPRGECLRLRLSAGRDYAFVFADVPLDWHRMLEIVRKATGVTGDIVPAALIGQRARVVLKHYAAKDGSTRAAVAKWLTRHAATNDGTGTQGPASAKPATATVSRNAPPQIGPDDDIPF